MFYYTVINVTVFSSFDGCTWLLQFEPMQYNVLFNM